MKSHNHSSNEIIQKTASAIETERSERSIVNRGKCVSVSAFDYSCAGLSMPCLKIGFSRNDLSG